MRLIDMSAEVVSTTASARMVGITVCTFRRYARKLQLQSRAWRPGDPGENRLQKYWLESEVKGMAFAREQDHERPKSKRLWGHLADAR